MSASFEDMKQDVEDYLGRPLPGDVSPEDVRVLWESAWAMTDDEAPEWFKGYATAIFKLLLHSATNHADAIAELKQEVAELKGVRGNHNIDALAS